MNIEWVRDFCLSLPHTTEHIQWGIDLVFKVGGKMFAVVPTEPARTWVSLKCGEEEFAELLERPGVTPAPYLARARWIVIESEDALPREQVERLLRTAHDVVFSNLPRSVQERLNKRRPRKAQRRRRRE